MVKEVKSLDELTQYSVGKKVLLYCSAPWCSPCKVFGPVLNTLHDELSNNVNFDLLKLNVDEPCFGDFLRNNSVSSVPSLLVYDNEVVVQRSVGALQKSQALSFLTENFGTQVK